MFFTPSVRSFSFSASRSIGCAYLHDTRHAARSACKPERWLAWKPSSRFGVRHLVGTEERDGALDARAWAVPDLPGGVSGPQKHGEVDGLAVGSLGCSVNQNNIRIIIKDMYDFLIIYIHTLYLYYNTMVTIMTSWVRRVPRTRSASGSW